jgi:AcrR family transcriptional regulator
MMSSSVSPRTYRSELRASQAAQTRARIVEAAAGQFASSGYAATTLSTIARAAGVSVETVKTSASKAELLLAAFETVFSGAEARDSLTETPAGAGVLDASDEVFVEAVIARIAEANARGHALWTVLLGAGLSDPVVAEALGAMLERRAADFRSLVTELSRRGLVAASVDTGELAAELSFLLSPESYTQLVAQWGWSPARYRQWLVQRVGTSAEASRAPQ